MTMALEGLRILDLSRLAPGPYCTMILGDMGADIIRVDPGGGRAAEAVLPIPPGMEEQMRACESQGRNKRSIVLNLKNEGAKEVFFKLLEKSDVVVEGFRAGVTKRLGIDYETVKQRKPDIVYCSITGWGQTGPYCNMVGHDINYISIGGALDMIGRKGDPPAIPGNLVADFAAGGMQAAIGILSALMAREKTGKGQHVDVAMSDGVFSLMHFALAQYSFDGKPIERGAHMLTGGMPFYDVYETKDGKYISLGSIEPWFFQNLCKALGREDLIMLQWMEDKHEEIRTFFTETFLTKTRDEWFEIMKQSDTCVTPVLSLDEVIADPHMQERNMIMEIDHPKVGKVKQVGILPKLSETPGEFRRFAPASGEHTEEILLEIGYSKEDCEQLRSSGALGT